MNPINLLKITSKLVSIIAFMMLLIFPQTSFSQVDISNQLDIELNTNEVEIEDEKNNDKVEKKGKSKREKLEKELSRLNELKYSTNNNDIEELKEIEEQIKEVKNEIKILFNEPEFIILIIVRYIYYPVTRNKDYLFTFLLISLTVFLLCVLLDSVKLELGFALGLFAIFGIIRYRTDPIPIKEMTYLFLVIGISVVNALANKKISHAELLFANLLIVFVTFGMERIWLLRHESRKNIIYEKIELIVPARREELMADLKLRTGIDIIRVEIRRIDFLKDVANIRIFYYEDDKK